MYEDKINLLEKEIDDDIEIPKCCFSEPDNDSNNNSDEEKQNHSSEISIKKNKIIKKLIYKDEIRDTNNINHTQDVHTPDIQASERKEISQQHVNEQENKKIEIAKNENIKEKQMEIEQQNKNDVVPKKLENKEEEGKTKENIRIEEKTEERKEEKDVKVEEKNEVKNIEKDINNNIIDIEIGSEDKNIEKNEEIKNNVQQLQDNNIEDPSQIDKNNSPKSKLDNYTCIKCFLPPKILNFNVETNKLEIECGNINHGLMKISIKDYLSENLNQSQNCLCGICNKNKNISISNYI